MIRKISKTILAAVLSLSLCACSTKEEDTPESSAVSESTPGTVTERARNPMDTYGNVYGMWFSFLDYQEMCSGMNGDQYTHFCREAVSNMQSIGINTLYLHAVSFTDAFYNSDIYPRTGILPDTSYDPFGIMLTAAKDAGMHVEAWINPLRSVAVGESGNLPDDFIVKKWIYENNERVRQVDGRYYLNPGYEDVRALIVSVVQEILDRYPVDGIHMDDHFYPSGTDNRFDAYVFSKASEENPILDPEDFRIASIDALVKEIHDTVKAENPDLWFGISPSGNNDNNIRFNYYSPKDWVDAGTVDYIIPQIYWGFLHPTKPYEATLDEWKGMVEGTNVKVISGLAAYHIGESLNLEGDAAAEWVDNSDMLARQTAMALAKGDKGVALFRYTSMFSPTPETLEQVQVEGQTFKAVLQ